MATLEDVPLLMKLSQQLDRIYEQSEQHLHLFSGYLSRAEQREENAEARGVRIEEALEGIEASLAEIARQTSKLARTAGDALEAGLRAGEATETRLKRLEGRSMLRRSGRPSRDSDYEPDETDQSEELDTMPPERPTRVERRRGATIEPRRR